MNRFLPIAAGIALVAGIAVRAQAADRVALLIANHPGSKGGVDALAKSLETAGFEVTLLENVSNSMRGELEGFASGVPTGGVALVYYSGATGRYDRKMSRTVTAPDGEKVKESYEEPALGIGLSEGKGFHYFGDVTRYIRERSRARLNLVFLDAVVPMEAKDGQGGFPEVDPADFAGGMICTSMAPGKQIPGGVDSSLAGSVARNIATRGVPLGDAMAKIKKEVAAASGGKQEVWWRFGHEGNARMAVVPERDRNISRGGLPPTNPKAGDEWINEIGMVFCYCPPGSVKMGLADHSAPATRDAKPVDAAISRGFWISKYEVTFGDYRRARGKDPSGRYGRRDGNMPMYNVSGDSASGWPKQYLMGTKSRAKGLPKPLLPGGWEYRLPTEAEWEHACRAGGQGSYAFGDDRKLLARYANYADAALHREDDSFYYADMDGDDGFGAGPAPVGSLEPNAWGIHDMHGNVSEFVIDQYRPQLPGGADPRAVPSEKESRTYVYRGGAWCSHPGYCQAGFRNHASVKKTNINQGYRVVLAPKR